MPTYEYACKECGEHVEVVQSFKDDPLTECPACGGPLRKVFAPVGIVLKGSGFYKTDSRAAGGSKGPKKDKDKKEASSSSESSSSSSSSSDSKSDSKPKEKKAESKSA
jgi:putative FmdB family regulatory protein